MMIWKLHQMCTDVFNLPQMRHVPGFRISSTPMEIAVFCILGYWCSDLCSLAGPAPYTRWDKKCDIRTHTWTQSFEQPFICLDLIVNFFWNNTYSDEALPIWPYSPQSDWATVIFYLSSKVFSFHFSNILNLNSYILPPPLMSFKMFYGGGSWWIYFEIVLELNYNLHTRNLPAI